MLLTTLNRTNQVSTNNHPWIAEMTEARKQLIMKYFTLLTPAISEEEKAMGISVMPSYEQVKDFFNLLIDYLSRGHFDIYPKILNIMEHVSSRRLTIARRLVPRIQDNTDEILKIADEYNSELDEGIMKHLKEDLAHLGQLLEIRFTHEDRMVIALQILENKQTEDAPDCALATRA